MTDLDEFERVVAGATAGPWRVCDPPCDSSGGGPEFAFSTSDKDSTAAIVALRNAAPSLLAELRALRAVRDAAIALHEAEVNEVNESRFWNDLTYALQESERAQGRPWPPVDLALAAQEVPRG